MTTETLLPDPSLSLEQAFSAVAQRMQGLTTSVWKDHVKPDPPADVDGLITKLAGGTAGFVSGVGETIQRTELTLRALEEILELWDEWAAGRRPFPPPVTDSNDVLKRVRDTPWPAPPAEEVEPLMKRAGEEIAKVRGSLPVARFTAWLRARRGG